MIHWLCPKPDAPSGGVMYIHKWAYLASLAGIPSRVIQSPHFGMPWWDASPPPPGILEGPKPGPGDTVIVPEVMYPIAEYRECRQILFVQNHMWMVREREAYNLRPETLVCSRYLYNYLEREFSIRPIGILHPYLDEGVWSVKPKQANRVLLILRRQGTVEQRIVTALIQSLEAQGFVPEIIREPVGQREIAAALDRCEFYVHYLDPEGFPIACVEAMRSGTIVVGTTGGGGNEFMYRGETAMVVQSPAQGRYTPEDFVAGVMDSLNWLRAHPDDRSRIWQAAHNVSLRYTAQLATEELLRLFG